MQLVVLAAGLGTRFGGVKQLAAVGPGGEAIMDYLLERAAAAGLDRGVVVVRPGIGDEVAAHFETFPPPVDIEIVIQQEPLGTADAVASCRGALDGPFAVVNADDLYPARAFELLASCAGEHALVAFRVDRTFVSDRPVSRARVVDDGEWLVAIEEATVARGSVEPHWVSMNIWAFQPRALGHTGRAPLLPDVVSAMVSDGERVRVLRCDEPCLGITYPEDVAALRSVLEGVERG